MGKKVLRWLGAVLASVLALNAPVSADEFTWFGERAEGRWLAGLHLGRTEYGGQGFKAANALGFKLGYLFYRPIGLDGSAALEFEMTTSTDGRITADNDFSRTAGKWDMNSMGLFFAYRTPGTVYFKAKLGAYQAEVENKRTRTNQPRYRSKGTSLGYGAGLGLRLMGATNFNLELEFTAGSDSTDADLITLGGIWLF